MKNFILVGIDPGTTIALAIFDLNRNLIKVESGKHFGKETIIEKIRKIGKPVLFACDVKPIPELVLELASSFNSLIFCPEKCLNKAEKRELAKNFSFSTKHEMDAIASGIKAFNRFDNKLRLIDRVMRELGRNKGEEIKYWVLNGFSIKNALMVAGLEPDVK